MPRFYENGSDDARCAAVRNLVQYWNVQERVGKVQVLDISHGGFYNRSDTRYYKDKLGKIKNRLLRLYTVSKGKHVLHLKILHWFYFKLHKVVSQSKLAI